MKLLYKETCGISESTLLKTAKELDPYIKFLHGVSQETDYTLPESAINLPFDENTLSRIKNIKNELSSENLKYVVVIGIGGSNLGAKAIYDALIGFYDLVEPGKYPKLIFLDTLNPVFQEKLNSLLTNLNPDELIINFISKSGTTTESISNLELIIKYFPKLKKRLVVTTDVNTSLYKDCQKLEIYSLPIPNHIGGRFSVFSAVGLFPLALAKINLIELLSGAMEMRQLCLDSNIHNNPAAISATIIYLAQKPILVNFFFNPELESLGKWYRQLMGESMGKTNKAVTPSVAIGTSDLHSVLQLYLGGPKDKLTNFVYSTNTPEDQLISPKRLFPDINPHITNKTSSKILEAIINSVKKSYEDENLPFFEVTFGQTNEKTLGKYMQYKMLEIMYLCNLMKVNTFNQPNVEKYKEETRKILSLN